MQLVAGAVEFDDEAAGQDQEEVTFLRASGAGAAIVSAGLDSGVEDLKAGETGGREEAVQGSLSLQQTVTPQHMLSRLSGATLTLTYGGRSLAGLTAGALGTALGLGATITLAAALGLTSTLILLGSPIRAVMRLPEQAA